LRTASRSRQIFHPQPAYPSRFRTIATFCIYVYAPTISRGGVIELSGGNTTGGRSVEVIEELPPVFNTEVTLRLPGIKKSLLAPSGAPVELQQNDDTVTIRIPEFSCHQMIELES
jgi:hypothetical protein